MSSKGSNPKPMTDLPFLDSGQKLFMTGGRLNAQAYKAAMRYQIEILGFLKHRCERDIKLIEDMLNSEELTGAFDVWSDFLQNAASEYASEANRIVVVGSQITTETAKHARRQAEEWSGDSSTRVAG